MANSWIMALKHWNSMKGGPYMIPKKGSKEYDEIKAVQNSMINGKTKPTKTKTKPKKGNGLIQLGKKKGNGLKQRPKKQSGRGNDDDWEDNNINIINEAEKAGVPVPAELSVVNTLYDTFGPKLPQVNKKTRKIRPAPGIFDFLNFEL